MINDKGILIKNIYYMLSYAFQVLNQKNYETLAAEDFDEVQDLFAAILARGISQQLKQGLYKEYIARQEDLSTVRGKIQMHGTAKNYLQRKKLIACEYDELSVDNTLNQILKTTAMILVRSTSLKQQYKTELKKVLLFFDEVAEIEPSTIRWSTLYYRRNNRSYEMLMNICYFVLDGMLQSTDSGSYKMRALSEEHMHRLYEKFVLEYYKRHHPELSEVKAAQVKWDLAEDTPEHMIRFLPVMQTDIFLRKGEKTLIIDTKYYAKIMQSQYEKATLHSGNLYQIYTYVKNHDTKGTGNVSGLLLYAKTEEDITPDCSFVMGGNRISVKTLDLNREFKGIAEQLERVVGEW